MYIFQNLIGLVGVNWLAMKVDLYLYNFLSVWEQRESMWLYSYSGVVYFVKFLMLLQCIKTFEKNDWRLDNNAIAVVAWVANLPVVHKVFQKNQSQTS